MEYYKKYMNGQSISPEAHQKLLELKNQKPAVRRGLWVKYGALAACAALIIGAGVWRLAPRPQTPPAPDQSAGQFAPAYTPLPGETGTVAPEDIFVVSSPVGEDQAENFFYMPGVFFQDVTGTPELARDMAWPQGSFRTELTKGDIQRIFWPEGKPENTACDLPWPLFWDGYTVCGYAWNNGYGELLEVIIFGEKGQDSFTLTLCPGHLPFACVVDPDRETSEAFGVEVTGWSRSNGREESGYTCGSEFMTKDDIGVRFESSGGDLEDASWFNTLFVRQALVEDGGLHLDHLLTNENIPAWREESFETLAQARREADFAPYLPTSEPKGYGEFYGRLSYQEGTQNTLFVRWSRGYDDVEVAVHRDGYCSYNLVSPEEPETYDLRLYSIPWADCVPQEHQETVSRPAFKAEDMSLAIVEARGREHDTGGMTYSFDILYPDGTLASCRFDGMTAEQVWAMVEETL